MSKVGSFSLHIFLLSRSNGYVIMHSYYVKATEANQRNPAAVEVALVVHAVVMLYMGWNKRKGTKENIMQSNSTAM